MNTQSQLKIRLNLTQRELEISGDSAQVKREFEQMMEKYLLSDIDRVGSVKLPSCETPHPVNVGRDNESSYFIERGIYALNEAGNVVITRTIPGESKNERMRKVALVALYAAGGKMLSTEISELCRQQGCLDKSNFAATFKDIETFMRDNLDNKRQYTVELTVRGKEEAKGFLEKLLDDETEQRS